MLRCMWEKTGVGGVSQHPRESEEVGGGLLSPSVQFTE